MARTNSFTIKASLTTLLFLISLICFYISYLDFMKMKDEETIIYDYNNNRIPVNPGKGFSAVELVSTLNDLGSNNGHYSLEPGGQIEWSSSPLKNLNT